MTFLPFACSVLNLFDRCDQVCFGLSNLFKLDQPVIFSIAVTQWEQNTAFESFRSQPKDFIHCTGLEALHGSGVNFFESCGYNRLSKSDVSLFYGVIEIDFGIALGIAFQEHLSDNSPSPHFSSLSPHLRGQTSH